jgi:hypothetical protein
MGKLWSMVVGLLFPDLEQELYEKVVLGTLTETKSME